MVKENRGERIFFPSRPNFVSRSLQLATRLSIVALRYERRSSRVPHFPRTNLLHLN